jgi:hypothetical protein
MEAELWRVLDAHQLKCRAAVDATGRVVARAGDFSAFASAGLVQALLGTEAAAKTTFDSLPGQLLPCIWGQGEEFAFVDSPVPDLAVIVFGRRRGTVEQRFALSRSVGRSLRSAFGPGSGA